MVFVFAFAFAFAFNTILHNRQRATHKIAFAICNYKLLFLIFETPRDNLKQIVANGFHLGQFLQL